MNKPGSKQTNEDDGGVMHAPAELRVRLRAWRIARIAFATSIVFSLVFILFVVSIYFLISGTSGKQSIIQSSLESNLQNAVGSEYKVVLETTDIQFEWPGLISVNSSDVKILRADNQKLVAEIGSIRFGTRLWRTLFGDAGFDSIHIHKARLSAAEFIGGAGIGIPSHIKPALSALGKKLNEFSLLAKNNVFRSLKIAESSITD